MTTKKISKEEKSKEIYKFYRLWWECLKRNDDYKELCDFFRENSKDNTSNKTGLIENFLKRKGYEGDFILHPLITLYSQFENVHIIDFERWYLCHKESLQMNHDNAVEVFDLQEEINSYNENVYKRMLGRGVDRYDGTVYLRIRLATPNKIADLLKRIAKILTEKRRNPDLRLARAKNNFLPFSNAIVKEDYLQMDAFERYLKVYDLNKQGLKMADIIKKIKPQVENKDVIVQRAFYLDLERAENVIKNAGLGVFPGDYQPGGKKGLKTKT